MARILLWMFRHELKVADSKVAGGPRRLFRGGRDAGPDGECRE